MQNDRSTTKTERGQKDKQAKVVGQVLVPPHKMSRLIVDKYGSMGSEPDFTVKLEPNNADMIGISQERLYENGGVTCIYHFQNFSNSDCQVTVLVHAEQED